MRAARPRSSPPIVAARSLAAGIASDDELDVSRSSQVSFRDGPTAGAWVLVHVYVPAEDIERELAVLDPSGRGPESA